MKYVLLLRGINVGGRNKVSMADLKDAITGLGYENVITYINSGNIIFNSTENIGVVNDKISQILNSYPFKINKVILTKQEYIEELKNLPSWWNDDFYRKDVLFYSEDIDFSSIKERINSMPLNEEHVYFGNRAVFWGNFQETNYLNTSYHQYLIKESFYKDVTIRNGRTFMKIAELLDKE